MWVEVSQVGDRGRPATTRLSRHTADAIRDHLLSLRPVAKEEVITDVLRALDLNRGWIVLGEEHELRCYVDAESPVLEDVVGPLVNRQVRVRTYTKGSRRLIRDIEPVDGDTDG